MIYQIQLSTRIPGYANYRVKLRAPLTFQQYTLNFRFNTNLPVLKFHHIIFSNRRATFSKILSTQQQTLNHILLVHKTFQRSIFNIVKLNSAPGSSPALVLQGQGPPSLDLTWGPLIPLPNPSPSLPMVVQCGETREGEEEVTMSKVCVAWTLPPILEGNTTVVLHTVVASSLKEVEEKVERVNHMNATDLLGSHTSAWEEIWREGRVEVDSADLELSRTVIGAQFYLLSSLPSSSPDTNCGMSPGSLAKGGPMADYEGHSFWDSKVGNWQVNFSHVSNRFGCCQPFFRCIRQPSQSLSIAWPDFLLLVPLQQLQV